MLKPMVRCAWRTAVLPAMRCGLPMSAFQAAAPESGQATNAPISAVQRLKDAVRKRTLCSVAGVVGRSDVSEIYPVVG
jgi:hypothetical protein